MWCGQSEHRAHRDSRLGASVIWFHPGGVFQKPVSSHLKNTENIVVEDGVFSWAVRKMFSSVLVYFASLPVV